jgi:hypothetical protein
VAAGGPSSRRPAVSAERLPWGWLAIGSAARWAGGSAARQMVHVGKASWWSVAAALPSGFRCPAMRAGSRAADISPTPTGALGPAVIAICLPSHRIGEPAPAVGDPASMPARSREPRGAVFKLSLLYSYSLEFFIRSKAGPRSPRSPAVLEFAGLSWREPV